MAVFICDLRVKIALMANLCKNIVLSHGTGPVGAAGAQVPYKHKVTGSNPVPATTIKRGPEIISGPLFQFPCA